MAGLDLAALPARAAGLDRAVTRTLARVGIPVLRIGLGAIFLWFGTLKLIPGLSPAEGLATRTIELLSLGLVSPGISLPLLAAVECFIGLGLLTGWFLRATLLVLAVQMVGTMTPLLLFPGETFTRFPFAPTLEGQSTSSRMSCWSVRPWSSARPSAAVAWSPSLRRARSR